VAKYKNAVFCAIAPSFLVPLGADNKNILKSSAKRMSIFENGNVLPVNCFRYSKERIQLLRMESELRAYLTFMILSKQSMKFCCALFVPLYRFLQVQRKLLCCGVLAISCNYLKYSILDSLQSFGLVPKMVQIYYKKQYETIKNDKKISTNKKQNTEKQCFTIFGC